jgi:hypothetical protein
MIQKNRHGATDNIRIRFQSQYTRFTDIDYGISDASFDGISANLSFETYDSSMNNDYADDRRSNNPLTEGIPF